MINTKYENLYQRFINEYKEIHPNPWHEINEEELKKIYNELINKININDDYSFNYFMNYIIKKLSGKEDAHTKYIHTIKTSKDILPINFKIIENKIYVNYPSKLKGYELKSINNIPIKNIINELDNIITYGTDGKRKYELEKALINKYILFSLPYFKDELTFELVKENTITKTYKKDEEYQNSFNYLEYLYGTPGEYYIKNNTLIYKHSSVQPMFEKQIKESIERLNNENLDNINKIIIDLRGNTGGNAYLNNYLLNFLKKNKDKTLICLTDYRVFSAGRYMLCDLIKLGALTIGEEISTPINSYGNSHWLKKDGYSFSISERYLDPLNNIFLYNKDDISKINKDEFKPIIFKPDIYITQTKEDFLNNDDTILNYALKYNKNIGEKNIYKRLK